VAIIYGMADSERRFINKLPGEVKNIDDIPKVKRHFERKVKEKDTGFFAGLRKWNYRRQVNKFDKQKDYATLKGAKGENKVIEELSKLNDNYHVFCGVNLVLPRAVTYNGERNLRSAQMDFVVVCPKGVFMIEVKNWSKSYARGHRGFSPYEQTERAGRVLWIELQNSFLGTRVTNVLLSIKGSFPYDRNYKSVFVSSLDRIVPFLNTREITLNRKQVGRLAWILKWHVTKQR